MGRGKADEIECDAAAAATARPGHPRARRTADASSAALAEGDSDIARISGTTATSGTARSAGAPVPASTADVEIDPRGDTSGGHASGAAGTADSRGGIAAVSAGSAEADDQAVRVASGAADSAGSAASGAAIATDSADRDECPSRASGTTSPAVADQPGRPAGAPGHPRRTRSAVAAVAEQQPAGSAGVPASRGTVGAVADQGAPQHGGGGRVDHPQQVLPEGLQRRRISGLGGRIHLNATGQRLDEPAVERHRLSAHGLVLQGMVGEQRRDGGRHLITGSGHQPGGRNRGCRIGRIDSRTETGHIRGGRRQGVQGRDHTRHELPLPRPAVDPDSSTTPVPHPGIALTGTPADAAAASRHRPAPPPARALD
ncbi:hypothetical protein MPS_0896 [Mycobacterium pseudoshottsii JCM 15466]|nr:hypothetical protein MPS_0896 [Mycobacterium pseudoshottsii JCM 15466]